MQIILTPKNVYRVLSGRLMGDTDFLPLEQKRSLIQFYRYVLNGVSHFFTGFTMLGQMYYRKTGRRCHFVPIYANKQNRTLTFGRCTDFDPDSDPNAERDRICSALREEMLRIAGQDEEVRNEE